MALRLIQKLVVNPTFVGLRLSAITPQNGIGTTKLTFSTQLLSELDLEKRTANMGPAQWKLCAAVCLVRLPIMEEVSNEYEKKYATLNGELEFENNIYEDWVLEESRQKHLDVETNQDIEDSFESSLGDVKEANTELDPEDADFQNVNRRPRDSLVFVTKQRLGNDAVWMLPCGEWLQHENLRESAERALQNYCGSETGAYFISNDPCGFYKYKFPKGARNDAHVGAKLFIYNAFLPRPLSSTETQSFKVENEPDCLLDYAWVAKDEMRGFLKPKYLAAISKMVL